MITRETLKQKLKDWRDGKMNARQVFDWANANCLPDEQEFDDQEGDDSVASEILFLLDVLDMNLSTADDVPLYLQFLETPKGGFEAGLKAFEAKFNVRDLEKRKRALKNDPLYAPFTR